MPNLAVPAGFPVPTYESRRATIVSEWINGYGVGSNTASDTVDGLEIDIFTRIQQIGDARLAAAFLAHFFNTAPGQNLDALLALFGPGHRRLQDAGSVVELLCYGKAGTIILNGSEVSTAEEGHTYQLDRQLILEDTIQLVLRYGPAVNTTLVSTTINGVVYAGGVPISGTGLDVAVNMQLAFPALGDAQIVQVFPPFEDQDGNGILVVEMTDRFSASTATTNSTSEAFRGTKVLATSVEFGDIPGEAFTINRVDTPRAGWEGVINLEDATAGRFQETNAEYRIRHKRILGQDGRATPLAMRAHILTRKGVEVVRIYENKTIANPDSEGRESHSFEVVVEGGDLLDLALEIYRYHPLGIQTHGDEAVLIRYLDQVDRVIKLSRPTSRYTWVDVDITPGEGFTTSPIADIQEDVRGRITPWGNGLGIGQDGYQVGAVQVVDVPGSQKIVIRFGTTASPLDPKPVMSPVDLVVAELEWLRFDDLRVTVKVLP